MTGVQTCALPICDRRQRLFRNQFDHGFAKRVFRELNAAVYGFSGHDAASCFFDATILTVRCREVNGVSIKFTKPKHSSGTGKDGKSLCAGARGAETNGKAQMEKDAVFAR